MKTLPAGASPILVNNPAGLEASAHPVIARLEPFLYQSMRTCSRCGGEQIFVAVYECNAGRVGVCLGCGEEKLIPFSRVTEAA